MIHNIASEGKPEQELTRVLNLIFQYENVDGVENFCQNEAPRFTVFADQPCGPSAGKKEFMVDGLLATLGNGIVPLNCSSLFATSLPVLSRTGFPPVSL